MKLGDFPVVPGMTIGDFRSQEREDVHPAEPSHVEETDEDNLLWLKDRGEIFAFVPFPLRTVLVAQEVAL